MREYCAACKKPTSTCYCAYIRPFSSSIRFVILIHHEEARRSVATGRMAHLCVLNSDLFVGTDFTEHEGVNALLSDPNNYPVVLYPGSKAINLSSVEPVDRVGLF